MVVESSRFCAFLVPLYFLTSSDTNMDEKGSEDALGVDEEAAETEVADRPRQPMNYAGRVAERTADNLRKPSVLAHLHAKQVERSVEPQKSQKRKSHDMEL